ncbi:MAG: ATP-binding cassette domain-containing protein [Acidobacteriota bacterium]
MIKISQLTKRFGDVTAVDGLDIEAADGRITGLLGPNGAGKTTAMRTLYGLMKPDAGQVTIDGVDVNEDLLGAMRRVGIFPDAVGLYDRLTLREHLRFYGEMHGLSGGEIEAAIDRVRDTLMVGPLIERRCKGFSHGERMKVALSRALIHNPSNLILDEPTNGLDVMSIRLLRGHLQRLRDDFGQCILFSSHVMQEVSALCDYIYIMRKGRVVAQGSPDELCRQAGVDDLEDAFIALIGTEEGLAL